MHRRKASVLFDDLARSAYTNTTKSGVVKWYVEHPKAHDCGSRSHSLFRGLGFRVSCELIRMAAAYEAIVWCCRGGRSHTFSEERGILSPVRLGFPPLQPRAQN